MAKGSAYARTISSPRTGGRGATATVRTGNVDSSKVALGATTGAAQQQAPRQVHCWLDRPWSPVGRECDAWPAIACCAIAPPCIGHVWNAAGSDRAVVNQSPQSAMTARSQNGRCTA